jgi:hypothetical protein
MTEIEEIKNGIHDEMVKKRFRIHGLDSFDENRYLNKYLKSKKPVGLFKNPGEKPFVIIEPEKSLGRVIGVNQGKNWLKLTWPIYGEFWIILNEQNFSIVGENLSEKEREEARKVGEKVAEKVMKDTTPLTYIGKKGLDTTVKVAEGVVNTSDTILTGIGAIGKNLNTIFLIVVVLIIVYVFFAFKKQMS